MEEVRDALDEARILCPDAPEIAELESRIAALPSPSALLLASSMSVQEPPAGWLRVVGAMCVLVLLFGLFGFGLAQLYFNVPMTVLTDTVTSTAPASLARNGSPAPTQPPAPSPPATAGQPQERPAGQRPPAQEPRREALREATQPRAMGTSSPPAQQAQAQGVDATRPPIEPAPNSLRTPRVDNTVPPPRTERSSPPVPAIAEPERWTHPPDAPPAAVVPAVARAEASPITDPVLPLDPPILSPSAAPPRAVPPDARDAVPASSRSVAPAGREAESAEIRQLLGRYETAYNRLDAMAASSLWPGVDRTALDRAFKGLISQRVSLGLCDITVVGDIGGASCSGKARWEPRVGGGLQTADRYWTFNLRKGSEGWRIEQIRVR